MSEFENWTIKEFACSCGAANVYSGTATIFQHISKESAEQRCREHNAFPVLVEALETISSALDFTHGENKQYSILMLKITADNALSAAKGEEEKPSDRQAG